MEQFSKRDMLRSPCSLQGYEPVPGSSSPTCKLRCDSPVISVDVDDCCSNDATTQSKAETDSVKMESSGPVKLKFLNGLRGMACLMVVHHHAYYLQEATLGATGVDIFFVLSAFLLTMLNESKVRKLINCKAGARQWLAMLSDYFSKRVLRVYPLFALVAFALACMTDAMRDQYYNINRFDLWGLLTFKYRYYLFWTIPVEITYYFIIPVFLVGVCLLDKFKWFAIAPLYVWVFYEGGHADRKNHLSFRPHLATFLTGSLAAVVYSDLSRWVKQRRVEPRAWHLAAVRAVEVILVSSIVSDTTRGLLTRLLHGSLFPSHNSDVPFVSLPISAVIVIETIAPSALSRALEWNVLCYTGKVSFSMYLLHCHGLRRMEFGLG